MPLSIACCILNPDTTRELAFLGVRLPHNRQRAAPVPFNPAEKSNPCYLDRGSTVIPAESSLAGLKTASAIDGSLIAALDAINLLALLLQVQPIKCAVAKLIGLKSLLRAARTLQSNKMIASIGATRSLIVVAPDDWRVAVRQLRHRSLHAGRQLIRG